MSSFCSPRDIPHTQCLSRLVTFTGKVSHLPLFPLSGETSLHQAAALRQRTICHYIVEAGASLMKTDLQVMAEGWEGACWGHRGRSRASQGCPRRRSAVFWLEPLPAGSLHVGKAELGGKEPFGAPSSRGVKSLFSPPSPICFSLCCFIKLGARRWNVSSLSPPSHPLGSQRGQSHWRAPSQLQGSPRGAGLGALGAPRVKQRVSAGGRGPLVHMPD